MIGFTSQSDFVTGVTATTGFINRMLGLLCYMSAFQAPPIIITGTVPGTFIVGRIYLVLSTVTPTSGFVPGTAMVFLTNAASSGFTITPALNTRVGAYTRIATDWVINGFNNNGVHFPAASFTFPNNFRGVLTIVPSSAITITAPAGLTSIGLFGTALVANQIYRLVQTDTNSYLN